MQLSSLQKGLVGHWRLDEQSFNPATKRFTDKSAYSNHGTGNGTQLGSATPGFQADHMGQLVRAAPFNGTDDSVNCGNDTSLNFTDAFTIEVLVKPNAVTAGVKIVNKLGITYTEYVLDISGTKWRGYVTFTDITNAPVISNTDVTLNWTHLVYLYDGNYSKIYLNSNLDATSNLASKTIRTEVSDVTIGSSKDVAAFFNGSINEVRIYNRALTQQEITALYESYRPKVVV